MKIRKDNLAKENIELLTAKKEIKFNQDLDISDKLEYKRIQEKSLSCELSATADIVSYFEWKKYSEDYIINLVDKDMYNQKPKIVNGKTIWGNPNSWYVWYIDKLPSWDDATQTLMTWYWVLEQPINKIYKWFEKRLKKYHNLLRFEYLSSRNRYS